MMRLIVVLIALSLSLSPRQWTLTTANFVILKKTLTTDATGALTFDWPLLGSSATYLYGAAPKRITASLTATFRIDLTNGSPVFLLAEPEPCGDPPSAHLFVWANHLGKGEFDRWWGIDAYPLAAGEQTVTLPIDPTRWVAVFHSGTAYSDEFAKAMQNVSAVGLTFGGALCNYGHGVSVDGGSARFTLVSYEVN